MDLLAERGPDAGDDAAHRRRYAAPAGGPRLAAADRLAWHRLCRRRFRADLRRPRSGQSARLVQFRYRDRPVASRRSARRRLSGARGPHRVTTDPSERPSPAEYRVPALLISIYGFGGTATSFVLPEY